MKQYRQNNPPVPQDVLQMTKVGIRCLQTSAKLCALNKDIG